LARHAALWAANREHRVLKTLKKDQGPLKWEYCL
jgi:hypothetical protein